MNGSIIRVILVDDSIVALDVLSRILSFDPDIKIVAKITDPTKVISSIQELKPDIICIDYFMPQLNGLELTKKIMSECPIPILIISGKLMSGSKEMFSVLEAGALDFLPKPTLVEINFESSKKYVDKLHVLSKVYVVKKRHQSFARRPSSITRDYKSLPYQIIVIGASTGGPAALAQLLGSLPKNFPVPIVCVQHISYGFLNGFVEWIASFCPLKVKIMTQHEDIQPGYVYLPIEDTHLEFNARHQLVTSRAPPVQQHRPSIDVTMLSAAKHFGKKVIAILLTGMGNDGAKGMLDVYQAGGVTIAQNEASSVVFGMPKEAIDLHAVKYILDLNDMPVFLENLFNRSLSHL